MQKIWAVALLALFLGVAVAQDDSDVMVLTDNNFDETISSNDFVFVEFYAPWCGHCKHLAPDWAKLATHFKQENSNVIIAKLDATENSKSANNHGVRGYPTLILFKNGSPIKYEQDRSLSALINFVNKKSGPASLEIKSTEELEKFQKKGGVVAYIDGAEDSTEYKNWLRAATSGQLEDFTLAHVFDASVRGDKKNTIIIYKDGEDPIAFPDDTITKTKVVSFILAEGYPLFEEISQSVWQRSQSSNKPLLAVFAESSDTKLVSDLAKAYKGRVIVTHAPVPANKPLAERWGASGTVFPTAILADWKSSNQPTLTIFNEETEKLTAETGAAFVDAALEDKYEGYVKSEPEPENNDGPVTIVTAKNYNKMVNDPEKDVFVEFYAPWCGHCKKLAPIWDELGEKFKGNDHIRIAKMDATANTPPKGLNIRGFPTLIFFPANNKSPGIPFNGDRDLESLSKFVKESSTKTIKEDL